MDEERTIDGSVTPVIITKEFGPTWFASIRVTADIERGGWVIERETGPNGDWIPWATIPGQLEIDYESCPACENGVPMKCQTCGKTMREALDSIEGENR